MFSLCNVSSILSTSFRKRYLHLQKHYIINILLAIFTQNLRNVICNKIIFLRIFKLLFQIRLLTVYFLLLYILLLQKLLLIFI